MTPTATYIAEENCLQLLPTMEKPHHYNYPAHLTYAEAVVKYETHLATLRKIPCDPSCKGLWADGQKLVVGKDYGVHSICIGNGCYAGIDHPCGGCEKRAFPLVPVKSEDEFNLHYEYAGMLAHYLGITIDGKDLEEKAFPELKKVFSLTKR